MIIHSLYFQKKKNKDDIIMIYIGFIFGFAESGKFFRRGVVKEQRLKRLIYI